MKALKSLSKKILVLAAGLTMLLGSCSYDVLCPAYVDNSDAKEENTVQVSVDNVSGIAEGNADNTDITI